MIAAVMQPYLFPYIGYFQLMSAVDVFVFLDDVQYIDRGWVNRNRIRVNGRPAWLTLPVRKESHTLPINQRSYLLDAGTTCRIARRFASAYDAAPHHEATMALFHQVMASADGNVASFNARQLQLLADVLGIHCRYEWASRLGTPEGLRGQDRIISLCRLVGADHYVNPIGGTGLYDAASFAESEIRLSFLSTTAPPAVLDDIPTHLSVLDRLMHAGADGVALDLPRYELLEPA